jgi:hypothetical protein
MWYLAGWLDNVLYLGMGFFERHGRTAGLDMAAGRKGWQNQIREYRQWAF